MPSDTLTTVLLSTLGGVGMFLLGMSLLTEGLRLAAGPALERVLERSTATRLRGLGAGMLITTLVQSSTATSVAAIGFVNSGLLSLRNALWVIFGANVGTTMNAWLVAWLGFGFKIDSFALPMVGIGAFMMLIASGTRTQATGRAMAGFAVLFLGIGVLKTTFGNLGDEVAIQDYFIGGWAGYLLLAAIGTVLTAIMQASGAVIAIVITAAAGGLLPIDAACAMVIGTNVGTTFSAVLSVIGATSNARRLAAAHVVFNLITGAVALALLPGLILLLEWLQASLEQPAGPAVTIAMFHTVFNVLGVLLMVPLSGWLLHALARRFKTDDERKARPRYLDRNLVTLPDMAVRALHRELGRTRRLAAEALILSATLPRDDARIARRRLRLDALSAAIDEYVRHINTGTLTEPLVNTMARELKALQHQRNAVEACVTLTPRATAPLADDPLSDAEQALRERVIVLAERANHDPVDVGALREALDALELQYDAMRDALLAAAAHANLDIRGMQQRLREGATLRRAARQLSKAAMLLDALEDAAMTEMLEAADDTYPLAR